VAERTETPQEGGLVRVLGPLGTTSIVIGGIIGSGIFISPAIVAREIGSPTGALAVWVVAGLIAACGALCFAELSAAVPETGGQYVFLRRGYRSRPLAFLFGWAMFFASFTGAIAAVATAFAEYAGYYLEQVIPYGPGEKRVVAIGLILFLTVINYLSVRLAGAVQNVATGLKLLALAGVIAVCLLLEAPATSPVATVTSVPQSGSGLLAAFGTALIPALFAYNGWTYSAYVAGEVRNPERNLPLSILAGIAIVLVVYLMLNVALLRVLPFEDLQTTTRPAALAMERLLGPVGGGLTALAVMISTFGTANAVLLSCTRTYYAMSKDGLFFKALERIHPRYRTPANAILVQGTLASLFALSGSFETILTYYAFVDFLFGALAVWAVVMLRKHEPDLRRPYRLWGYPLTPLVFAAFSAWYLINTLIQRPLESAVGIVLTLSGIPFYLYWTRRAASRRKDALS